MTAEQKTAVNLAAHAIKAAAKVNHYIGGECVKSGFDKEAVCNILHALLNKLADDCNLKDLKL